MRRTVVHYAWDGGRAEHERLVRVTVLERSWFRERQEVYVGRFRSGLLTAGWEFWTADTGCDLGAAEARELGQALLSAMTLDRAIASTHAIAC